MRILISNDDGIYSPGILALYRALRGLGELIVVAPHAEQSAVGHAITISDPIKLTTVRREDGFEGQAVVGTPADCVKLAVSVLLDKPPDLVVSGINLGPNVGISLIYSGTVSAATEGTILGIPSLAVSIDAFKDPRWDTAGRVARRLAEEIIRRGLPPDVLLNVNVPNRPAAELQGFALTRMGRSRFAEIFHQRVTPRGETYYWLDGELQQLGDVNGTDFQALARGCVSVTPVGFDLTHHTFLPELRQWNLAL